MASMSKLALWCVILLMFTFTLLVYISPAKPSLRSVLQIQDDSTPDIRPVQSLASHDEHEHEPVHKHISIASSSPTHIPHDDKGPASALQTAANRSGALAVQRKEAEKKDQTDEEEAAFMRAQREIQKHRRAVVDRVCKKYNANAEVDVLSHPPWNVIVDEKYKLVYCFVQKVACTNWKKVFLVLSGHFNRTEDIPQFFTNRQGAKLLKSLEDYPEQDRIRIMRDYTKFMFARHPFSRVLSAYRNKLAPDSTFSRASQWQRKVGQRIINQFRGGGPNPAAGAGASSQGFNKSSYDLSFGEFVKFVSTHEGGTKGTNKHWRDLYTSCMPCKMQYDIIGKIETIEDDARYILSLSGAKEAVNFPSAEGSSPTNSSDPEHIQKYFAHLPSKDITDLYNRYIVDFKMFDYHAKVDDALDVR